MMGTLLIKAPSYKMVQENSKHGVESYWYSIEHKSKKSVCHLLFFNKPVPYSDPGR